MKSWRLKKGFWVLFRHTWTLLFYCKGPSFIETTWSAAGGVGGPWNLKNHCISPTLGGAIWCVTKPNWVIYIEYFCVHCVRIKYVIFRIRWIISVNTSTKSLQNKCSPHITSSNISPIFPKFGFTLGSIWYVFPPFFLFLNWNNRL